MDAVVVMLKPDNLLMLFLYVFHFVLHNRESAVLERRLD